MPPALTIPPKPQGSNVTAAGAHIYTAIYQHHRFKANPRRTDTAPKHVQLRTANPRSRSDNGFRATLSPLKPDEHPTYTATTFRTPSWPLRQHYNQLRPWQFVQVGPRARSRRLTRVIKPITQYARLPRPRDFGHNPYQDVNPPHTQNMPNSRRIYSLSNHGGPMRTAQANSAPHPYATPNVADKSLYP